MNDFVKQKKIRKLEEGIESTENSAKNIPDATLQLPTQGTSTNSVLEVQATSIDVYMDIQQNMSNVKLPSTFWSHSKSPDDNNIYFTRVTTNSWPDVTISLSKDMKPLIPEIKIHGKIVPQDVIKLKFIQSINTLNEILAEVNELKLCEGIGILTFSDKCCIFTPTKRRKACDSCDKKKRSMRVVVARQKKVQNGVIKKGKSSSQRLSQNLWRAKSQVPFNPLN